MGGYPVMPPSGCECSRARLNYGWLTKTSWVPGRRARDISVGSVGLRRRSGVLIVLATVVVLTGLTVGAALFQPCSSSSISGSTTHCPVSCRQRLRHWSPRPQS